MNDDIIMVMGKECKLIPATDNQYAISKDGHVYSLLKSSGWYTKAKKQFFKDHPDYNEDESGLFAKEMNQYEVNSNYMVVHLKTGSKFKMYYIHRLVAEAFIYNDDPINKTDVNHKDENKHNNDVSNLEFITRKENVNLGNAQNVHRSKRGMKRENATYPVALYREGEIVKVFKSIADAARWISPEKWNSKKAQLGYILTSTTKTRGFKTVGGYTPKLLSYKEMISITENNPHLSGLMKGEAKALKIAGEENFNSIIKKLTTGSLISTNGEFLITKNGKVYRVADLYGRRRVDGQDPIDVTKLF